MEPSPLDGARSAIYDLKYFFIRMKRLSALAISLAALASLGLMFYVGRRNRSFLLITLFTLWVLSPFGALAWANFSRAFRNSPLMRIFTLLIPVASVTVYSMVAVGQPPKPAFWFLVVPLLSWLLIAVAGLLAARVAPR